MRPFLFPRASKHQADGDGNELHHSALCGFSRDAVVSGFKKGCERANAKSRAEPGVKSEVVLRLRTRGVGPCVIEPTADDDVRFRARAGKCINQVAECPYYPQVVRDGAGASRRQQIVAQKVVVDPIEAYSDWEFRHSYRQRNDAVVTRILSVAQFSNRYGSTSAYSQRVGLLAQGRTSKRQGNEESNPHYSKELLHDWPADVVLVLLAGFSERAI